MTRGGLGRFESRCPTVLRKGDTGLAVESYSHHADMVSMWKVIIKGRGRGEGGEEGERGRGEMQAAS